MQTVMQYQPQTQPGLSTMSQPLLTSPTPNTTAVNQIAPMPAKRHKSVWAVYIPCDGSRIQQKMCEISIDQNTGGHVPLLDNWLPKRDPAASVMVRSLFKCALDFGICRTSLFSKYIIPVSKSLSIEVRLIPRTCLEPVTARTRSLPSRRQLSPLHYP